MTRIDGGGSGERLARVALAGTAGINGGELLNFLGHGTALRRSPGDALVHETEGNKVWVSAVSKGKRVRAREERRGQCGVAAMTDLDGGSGCGRARPPGGARRVEMER